MLTAIKREYKFVTGLLRMKRAVKDVDAESDRLIADELEKRIDAFGPNLAFIEGDLELTYDDMEIYANKVAAWVQAEGCKAGDTVAVFVRNRAQYVPLWLGLTKVGVIPALLNYQLTGPALAHCLNISDAKILIVDHEMAESFETAKQDIKLNLKVFGAFGVMAGYENFDAAIADHVPNRPPKTLREGIKAGDQCMKMFTSGTTGTPKGVVIPYRVFNASKMPVETTNDMKVDVNGNNRFFSYLPLNHIAERVVVECTGLTFGGEVYFSESLATFAKNLADAKPTAFFGVPRIYTKFQQGILGKMPQKKLDMLLKIPIVSGMIKKKLRTVFHAYLTQIHKETKKKLIFYFDVTSTIFFPK